MPKFEFTHSIVVTIDADDLEDAFIELADDLESDWYTADFKNPTSWTGREVED